MPTKEIAFETAAEATITTSDGSRLPMPSSPAGPPPTKDDEKRARIIAAEAARTALLPPRQPKKRSLNWAATPSGNSSDRMRKRSG